MRREFSKSSSCMQIDERLIKTLFDNEFESVCAYLGSICRDTELIREVVQESFVKLWEERDVLMISNVKSYLYRCARNRMLNALRDREVDRRRMEDWSTEEHSRRKTESIPDESGALLVRVNEQIRHLPLKCREIFVLAKLHGWSHQRIAEHCDLSVKTVENQVGIALKKLRESLLVWLPYGIVVKIITFLLGD